MGLQPYWQAQYRGPACHLGIGQATDFLGAFSLKEGAQEHSSRRDEVQIAFLQASSLRYHPEMLAGYGAQSPDGGSV